MEKAALRGIPKKESPEQVKKKEAVYTEKIAAWKVSNQASAVKEAHAKPVGEANIRAAEVDAALRKEAVEPPPNKKGLQGESNTNDDAFMDKVDAWIAFCDRNKADGKEPEGKAADDKVLQGCFSVLRDETTEEAHLKKFKESLTAFKTLLAAALPEDQKQMLGERLNPLVILSLTQLKCLGLAGKITGMLLEFDNAELLHMLEDLDSLMGKVKEAEAVLRAQQVEEGAFRVDVSCQAALDDDDKKITRVSVSCQTALEEEELEDSAESLETAAEEATNEVAPDEASKRAAQIEAVTKRWGSALEANLRKAPQTKKFLEEVLPRVSIPCQAGVESGGPSLQGDPLLRGLPTTFPPM